ncbi:Glutamate receptor, ionotropic kainate 2 [Atta colombica]|uniref:Glutamate receptor, ionotropic kainate 2 n=1 Tax=Atta colombica TaxID=520822 RepID=A0A195BLD7_9HYME|nr:Glutamate receptor, ionotropic kainate 2 [Atta colombica]
MLLLYITVVCIPITLGFPRKISIDKINKNVFQVANILACELINNGFATIFGPQDKITVSQSMCGNVINLYSHFDALSMVFIFIYELSKYAVFYDNADGLIRINRLQTLDLKHYQYSGVNLMSVRLIDPDSLIVRELIHRLSGMIRFKIIASETNLAITDLTAAKENVRFYDSFMNLNINVLYKILSKTLPGLLSFLRPFSKDIWVRVIGAYSIIICGFLKSSTGFAPKRYPL